MGNTSKEGGLNPQLKAKIDCLDKSQPYIWKLRLSEADFKEIETCLTKSVAANGGSHAHLLTVEWAMIVITYMAEWYKRRYQSGNTNDLLSLNSDELKQLWEVSGISKKVFVYRDDNGSMRWQYSTYVLGGLAIHHELNRNDNGRFLKGLCRIYHGENFTLENLDDATRAVAFRESISRKHSLYEYMKEILNGQLPFNEDELKNGSSDVNRFVAAIKSANDEILKLKFRFEWVITFNPQYAGMTRKLRLWLKPEEVGGGLHQYLRYDRVHLWGVTNPEQKKQLKVALSFWDGDTEIVKADFENPLINYSNTGESETGFLSWGVDDYAVCHHVPTRHFTKIQVKVQDEDGLEYVAQEQQTTEYMQLWRKSSIEDEWTSTNNAQKETALVFSSLCRLDINESCLGQIHLKPFTDKVYGKSKEYGWFYIYDNVTLVDERGRCSTFYNRIGYDQITSHLYLNTISYKNGGKVEHWYIDDPDYSDEPEAEELPLIFKREDVIVRHFETKDAIKDARPETEGPAENVEYKQSNGRHTPWTAEDKPAYGVVQLRITIKDKPFNYSAIYLPPLEDTDPVVRVFDTHDIKYMNISEEPQAYHDDIQQDGTPLFPYVGIKIGQEDDYFLLNIYRPTLQKELCVDGRVVKYTENEVYIPYILKEELTLNDFSTEGFRSYSCNNLSSIYPHLEDVSNAHLDAWSNNRYIQATALDDTAPACLHVGFGQGQPDGHEQVEYYLWDYDKDKEPEPVDYKEEPAKNCLIFQSLKHLDKELTNIAPKRNFFAFGYGKVKARMSYVKCFDVAIEHRLHFFMLEPFTKLKGEDYLTLLYQPLLEAREGELSEQDKKGLLRLADEFQFNWEDFNIQIDY